ncbi:MAG: zinc-dependent alcohol dehydrogenase [Bacteroidota bacterium]
MLQAVMTAPGTIEFREIPVPEVERGQVLVRIIRIGVCGSDIHVYHGKHAFTSYPVVQGHEVSGIVEKVGSRVSSLKPGDKVTIRPQVVCGECYACAHGNYHICDDLKVMGFQTTGTASEYFAVDAGLALKLPDSLTFEEGALIEPLAVAVRALERGGGAAGRKVLVLGAGTIGNLVAQAAKGMGAESVLITNTSDYRLQVAAACGIEHCVNPSRTDLGQELVRRFGKDRADLTFECVGAAATVDQAIKYARKGTDIVIVGIPGEKPAVDIGAVQQYELRLIGTMMYQEDDFRKAIELVQGAKLSLKPLVTHHFAFRDYLKAYEYIDEHKSNTMKVMIDVQEA